MVKLLQRTLPALPEDHPNRGTQKLAQTLWMDYLYKKFRHDFDRWLMSTSGLQGFVRLNAQIHRQNWAVFNRFVKLMKKCDYWRRP